MSRARGDEKDEEDLMRLIDSVSPGSSSFQPRPRAAAPVGETTGSGGLRLLTEEANRQGGGSNRESIGYGRPDMTPGTVGDDSEEANQMEVFKEFLSKDAARKLQGMIDAVAMFRKSNQLDMVSTMRACIQDFVAAETAGSRGLPTAVPPGGPSRSLGDKGLTVADQDLTNAFKQHVSDSSLFNGDIPCITLDTPVSHVFTLISAMLDQLSMVRPHGGLLAMMIGNCLQVDQVKSVCQSALLPPGEISPHEQAFAMLELAAQAAAARGSSAGGYSSSVHSGRYIGHLEMLNAGYNYIMAPENQAHLPESVKECASVLQRLDQMTLNVLLGGAVLDCPWRREASVLNATNTAKFFHTVLSRLGHDNEARIERAIAQLEETPVLPVSPCSVPLQQYLEMLKLVWDYQLRLHEKLQVNTAERLLRKAMSKVPVASDGSLARALEELIRSVKRGLRTSGNSASDIVNILDRQIERQHGNGYSGFLKPHGSGKPSGSGGGNAYLAGQGGSGRPQWCYNCGTADHASNDCTEPWRCHVCGDEGHERWACPKVQKTSADEEKPAEEASDRGRSARVGEPGSHTGRSSSPNFRPKCERGVECPDKECTNWHPAQWKHSKQAKGGGKGGKNGKGGKGGKKGKGGGSDQGSATVSDRTVAQSWFAVVVPRDAALLAHDTAGSPKQEPSESVSSSKPLRPVHVSWGPNDVKEVTRVPRDAYAPSAGELSATLSDHSRWRQPARSSLRGRPPQEFEPHVELEHNLLDHKRTVMLYREYSKRNITKTWLNMTGDQKRHEIVMFGASWIERLNRFFVSCLRSRLPLKEQMIKDWNRLTRPPRPVRWHVPAAKIGSPRKPVSLRVPTAATSSSAVASAAVAPSAVPSAIVPAARSTVDIRGLESAAANMEAGAYLVNASELAVVDSGCTVEGLTKQDADVYDVEELPQDKQLTVTGIAGNVEIKQTGKRGYRILSSVYHADSRVQNMLSAIHARFRGEDRLYYYFEIKFYLSPHMRPGLSLISCGAMVIDLGWTALLDRDPTVSHVLTAADSVTSARLRFPLRFGVKERAPNAACDPHDRLLHIPGLEKVAPGVNVKECALRTWEVVRKMCQDVQEQIAVEEQERLEEIENGPYSLYGYVA